MDITDDKIAAVLVTFFPEVDFEERLEIVLSQVGRAVIVDNTPTDATDGLIARLRARGCHVIKNPANFGVARALNQGITWAAEQGVMWVLTLDQDTRVYPGLIDLYRKALAADLAGKKVGVINTLYRDVNTGKTGFAFSGKETNDWMDVSALITSGSFFSIDTYRLVGPFRDDFFLDFADHDFCLRARAKGLRNFIYNRHFVDHALGKKTEHKILFGLLSITATNHSPVRCYLINRNLVVLIKKNFFREFHWSLFVCCYIAAKFVLVLCFEQEKLKKIRNLWDGFWDGVFNRTRPDILKHFS